MIDNDVLIVLIDVVRMELDDVHHDLPRNCSIIFLNCNLSACTDLSTVDTKFLHFSLVRVHYFVFIDKLLQHGCV